MPIAHISLPVSSLSSSTAFYLSALKPLGYDIFMKLEDTVGLTVKYDGPDFWLHQCSHSKGAGNGVWKMHVAFKGSSERVVKEFYEAALCVVLFIYEFELLIRLSLDVITADQRCCRKAGAKDNGPPGERPQYTKGYYAAYVLDLDGNNIECVYYQPWWLSALQVAPSVLGAVLVAGVAWWGGRAGWGL